MISNSARDGFNFMLMQGIRSSMVTRSEDQCEITAITDTSGVAEPQMVVITISSYLFRLMVFIHFALDNPTKEHLARTNNAATGEMSERAFIDAMCESANMCCGAMSRDLGNVFPHIGMSTPNILDRECVGFLDLLNCGHIQHFKVGINQTTQFHVTLCVSEYANLDFSANQTLSDMSTGELEMF